MEQGDHPAMSDSPPERISTKRAKLAASTPATDAFWQLPGEEMAGHLGSGENGLSPGEAAARLLREGANRPSGKRSSGPWRILLAQFKSPILLILVFAALLSLYLGDILDSVIILAIILASGLLSFFQEYAASGALAKLQEVVKVTTTVKRGGEIVEIPNRPDCLPRIGNER